MDQETKQDLKKRSLENIKKASKEVKNNQDLYIAFMNKRFTDKNHYTHISYAMEWKDRFNSGDPKRYMDLESIKVYNDLRSQN